MNTETKIQATIELPFPRDRVWPPMARSDWVDETLGLRQVARSLPSDPDRAEIIAQARWLGFQLQWQESPWHWLEGVFYRGRWTFQNGPLTHAEIALELRDNGPEGTWVRAEFHLTARRLWAAWLVRFALEPRLPSVLESMAGRVTRALGENKSVACPKALRSRLDEGSLRTGLTQLAEQGCSPELLARLEDFVREAADAEVLAARPLALARVWAFEPQEVVRLFLHSTRGGLFELNWRVLCPACRLPCVCDVRTLAEVPEAVTCEYCRVAHAAEFDRTVELAFAVNPAVRRCPAGPNLLPTPGNQPHIASQALLAPGERRAWRIPPLIHPMRLRSPQVKEPVKLTPDDAPTRVLQPVILCEPDAFKVRLEYGQFPDYALQVLNPTAQPVLLILERLEWSEDILTAAQVRAAQG